MSLPLPPNTIRIKRKATDEPVEFLRVHEPQGKRQRRATAFVFSRQPATNASQPSAGATQTKHTVLQPAAESKLPTSDSDQKTLSFPNPREMGAPGTPNHAAQMRRFHLTKSTPVDSGSGERIGPRTSRSQPAIFVERKSRPANVAAKKPLHKQEDKQNVPSPLPEPAQAQKKPGLAARTQADRPAGFAQKPPQTTLVQNMRLPSSLVMPWNVNSEELAAEMQAYTLETIGKNLAASDASRPASYATDNVLTKRLQSRFKPKKPALRYHERHPNEALDMSSRMEVDDNFSEDELDDDAEYIIETYVRVPADAVEASGDRKNFGLLILDSQPDIDKFYLEDSDSDEDEVDEDDENAENYYTADYPDDEIDSDDEFDRDPYSYATHKAFDSEEFGDDDATFSDDEADRSKYPWANRS